MTGEPMPDTLAEDAMRIQHVLNLLHEGSLANGGVLSVIALCADLCGELRRKIDRLPMADGAKL